MIRDEHLADCARRLAESRKRFDRLAERVGQQAATWQPAPQSWSVAECVEHLNVSMDLYERAMLRAVEDARNREVTGEGPWKSRTLTGRLLLWGLDPSARRSIPAPRAFRPRRPEDLDFSLVCDRFRDRIERFEHMAHAADGLALDRVRLPTPIGPLFRVTLAEAFEIHARHIPRHLAQAEAVTKSPGFPG